MKEFGAKLTLKDNMSATLKKNIQGMREFSKQVEQVRKAVNAFGGAKASPVISIKDKASKGLDKVKSKLSGVMKEKASPVIDVVDRATKGIHRIRGTINSIGKTVAKPFIAVKDGASKVLSKVGSSLKSIGGTVATAMVKVKDGASKILGSIGDKLKGLAKGAVIGLAVSAGAGVMKALSEGGKLQQSQGGVETMFKGDAGAVMENANKAFKTAGMSANEYMETVTGFSASLISSLGGDTKKSAKISDMAITDMADNANKFGTDMESIQNAYQGFAKQNYTMLDNLKLGYGGTKEEMSRLLSDAQKLTGVKYDINNLSDVYSAIHAVQENLGVTGTTAKEASATFSGSLAMMKASAQNLFGSLSVGDGKAVAKSMGELVDSASTFLFDNLIPMVTTIVQNIPSALATAIPQIIPKIKKNVLPLAESIKDGIFSGLEGLGFDGGALSGLTDALGGLGGTLISGTMEKIQAMGDVVKAVMPDIIATVTSMVTYLTPVIGTFQNIFIQAMPVVQGIIQGVCSFIQGIMPTVSSIFQTVGDAVSKVLSMLGNHMGLFQNIVQVVVTVVGTVWNALAPVISTAVDLIITVVDGLLTGIEAVFDFLAPYIQQVWDSISGFFSSASATITTIVETLQTVFTTMYDVISGVFEGVSGVISSVCGSITSVISGVVDKISGFIDTIGKGVSAVKDFVGGVGDKVAGAFGFAYGKNRVPYDNYPARLHQGERVLTRVQADQYDEEHAGTRGIPSRAMGTGVIARDNTLINAHQGEKLLTKQEVKQRGGDVNLNVDFHIGSVSNMGDIEEITQKITSCLVKKLEKVATNMA